MQQVYTPPQNFKVLVRTITYNQAKYITDTLNGVAMQQTNFPFVHYVIDDCSTDGEQEVIMAWINEHCDMDKAEYIDLELANVILVPHRTNINLTFAIYLLKRNLRKEQNLKGTFGKPWNDHCEYEALCEGDDYWTHPEKLQKQVDILDNNPDCTLCYHACKNLFEKDFKGYRFCFGEEVKTEYSFEELCTSYPIHTATVLYRSELSQSELLIALRKNKFSFGDVLLYMAAAHVGRVIGIADRMSVYRRTNSGISVDIHKGGKFISDTKAWISSIPLFTGKERACVIQLVRKRLLIGYTERKFSLRTLATFTFTLSKYSLGDAMWIWDKLVKAKVLYLIRR